jgi:hypothetical protein
MNKKLVDKFREVYNLTLENTDLTYTGNLTGIDYFGLFCKATAQDRLYKFFGLNTCMFNFVHENQDSVLILFSIPNGEESSTKFIADKVMDIVELGEQVFITIDYIISKEIKDDKFTYVTLIKKLKNNN